MVPDVIVQFQRKPFVNRVRPARMKDLDDLRKTVPRRPPCGPLDLQPSGTRQPLPRSSYRAGRPPQIDRREHQRPPNDSAGTSQRCDDVSPVFIEPVPPRSTTGLAGFHVETQPTLSLALSAVRNSVLSRPATLAVQRLGRRARGRGEGTW